MSGEKDRMHGQEKTKITSQVKHVPKDAQVIMSIMKEMNITSYEPRVVNQLLEFTYRYITCILDDAKAFANHSRKKTIDLEDVRLATEVVLDKAFTCPPPRHALAKLAETRNGMPLPPIKPHCGLRLPPDRYCLSACNYKLRSLTQPKKMVKTALEGRSGIKTQVKFVSSGATKRQTVMTPKTQVVTIPKPVIKFTTAAKPPPMESKLVLGGSNLSTVTTTDGTDVKLEMDEIATSTAAMAGVVISGSDEMSIVSGAAAAGLKREREDDEFD